MSGPPAIRLDTATSMQPLPSPLGQALRSPGTGEPLAPQVARPIASSLGIDPAPVRVYTGAQSAAAADLIGARAFAWGRHVFLGSGQQPSDLRLMAHEVSHVVQQQARPAIQLYSSSGGDRFELEAQSVSAAVVRGEPASVQLRTGGPVIQGDWLPSWARRGVSAVAGAARAVGGAVVSGAQAVVGAAGDLLAAARNRVLNFLRERARSFPGYDLLSFILGRDPISQEPVERSATNLIRALLGLVPGGQQMFENLQRARVIERAYAWLTGEIAKLNFTWPYIRGLFQQAWDSFSLADLASPSSVWDRIRAIFAPPLGRLRDFAVSAGRKILEFIFEGALALGGAAAQRVLGLFRRIGATFSLIANDPVRFLSNLLEAVKGGFRRFADNILAHLRTALFEWLFGALQGAGLSLPQRWDFMGIIGLVLQVLGLAYARMRERLVRLIGEPAVAFIERAFEFLRIIVTRGLAAAWERILEFATGLVDTVIEGIRNWVITSVVRAAVTRLATMFNPVGAIINAIITIYNTVMFFIERAQQLAALLDAIVDSISNIATGNLGQAIAHVERTLARTLTVILSFLARLLGLGGISDTIRNIIRRIQATVDRAIDRVINWVRERAQGLLARMTGAGDGSASAAQSSEERVTIALSAATQVLNRFADRPVGRHLLRPLLAAIRLRYRLSFLEALPDGDFWVAEAAASPGRRGQRSRARTAPGEGTITTRLINDNRLVELIVFIPVAEGIQRLVLVHSLQRHHYLMINTGAAQAQNSIMHRSLAISSVLNDAREIGVRIQERIRRYSRIEREQLEGEYRVSGRTYLIDTINLRPGETNHFFVIGGDSVWERVSEAQWNAAQSIRRIDVERIPVSEIRRMHNRAVVAAAAARGVPRNLFLDRRHTQVQLAVDRLTIAPGIDNELGIVSGRPQIVSAVRFLVDAEANPNIVTEASLRG